MIINFTVGKFARLILYPHDRGIHTTEKDYKYTYDNKHLSVVFLRYFENNMDTT